MINKIIDQVNKQTDYRLEYDVKDKILFIRTDKGIRVKDFIKIRRAVEPYVKDIRVTSRW